MKFEEFVSTIGESARVVDVTNNTIGDDELDPIDQLFQGPRTKRIVVEDTSESQVSLGFDLEIFWKQLISQIFVLSIF